MIFASAFSLTTSVWAFIIHHDSYFLSSGVFAMGGFVLSLYRSTFKYSYFGVLRWPEK